MAGKSDLYRLKYMKYLQGNLSNVNGVDYFQQFNEGQPFTTVDSDNDTKVNRNSAEYRQKGFFLFKEALYY